MTVLTGGRERSSSLGSHTNMPDVKSHHAAAAAAVASPDPYKFSRFVWNLVHFLLRYDRRSSSTSRSQCYFSSPPSSPFANHSHTYDRQVHSHNINPSSPSTLYPSPSTHCTSPQFRHDRSATSRPSAPDHHHVQTQGIQTIHRALSSRCAASSGVCLPIILNALLIIDRYAAARDHLKTLNPCTCPNTNPLFHSHSSPSLQVQAHQTLIDRPFDRKRTRSAPHVGAILTSCLPETCKCTFDNDAAAPEHMFLAALMIATKIACDAAPGAKRWATAAKLYSTTPSFTSTASTFQEHQNQQQDISTSPTKKRRITPDPSFSSSPPSLTSTTAPTTPLSSPPPSPPPSLHHLPLVTLERDILSTLNHNVSHPSDTELHWFGEAVRSLAVRMETAPRPPTPHDWAEGWNASTYVAESLKKRHATSPVSSPMSSVVTSPVLSMQSPYQPSVTLAFPSPYTAPITPYSDVNRTRMTGAMPLTPVSDTVS